MIRPRVPRLLDADDVRVLTSLLVLSVVAFWALLLLAFALGLGVRVFLMAKGG